MGHYWSVDESRDIGTFNFKKGHDGRSLSGPLTVYNTKADKTTSGIDYAWYYLPPWIVRRFRPVRRGASLIDKTGLFVNKEFLAGATVGPLVLGVVEPQGEHTIFFNGEHHVVKEPWCFLNHCCRPNAKLVQSSDSINLKAIRQIMPQTELTIDYRNLLEKIGTSFECHCGYCCAQGTRAQIGDAQLEDRGDE